MKFKLNPKYQPRADQPRAIEQLAEGVQAGENLQTLLGATGTGKTFTVAGTIERLQKPSLVIAPNKTLAAQLVGEFRELFPKNRVEYFVSYYDHYQPEAYVPHQDLFIEKDASVNEDIDRLRHAATEALLQRRDTIIVASVSCIYGIGSPQAYERQTVQLRTGDALPADFAATLSALQYSRNDALLQRAHFSWRGEVLEIWPPGREDALRIKLWGDEIEALEIFDPLTREVREKPAEWRIWPASHWVASEQSLQAGIEAIEKELREQLRALRKAGKRTEAERLQRRTEYDLEMLREMGWTSGIENYSRAFDGRAPGEAPSTLLDYFPDDFLLFIDESHQTVPQIGAMHSGDRARKQTLVEHGFRLPSALDNRPLRWEEFRKKVGQVICMSATPGAWEREHSGRVVEQLVRPTGILDPEIEVRKTEGQVDNLLKEIADRKQRDERVLVTTLSKQMAEDLAEYFLQNDVRARYLHSAVDTLERIRILRDLRAGKFDVLVGVNLLREGLDLPEVSLVAILDADREGFLRGETALVQTIGRAARNPRGQVILYADRKSGAMRRAIAETNRRRGLQTAYNKKHNLSPEALQKGLASSEDLLGQASPREIGEIREHNISSKEDLQKTLLSLQEEMALASEELRFEDAARLRDEIVELRAAEGLWNE